MPAIFIYPETRFLKFKSLLFNKRTQCIYMLSKVLFLIILFYNMYSFFPSVLCSDLLLYHIQNMQTLCRQNYLEDKHSAFNCASIDNFCGGSLVENCFSSANVPRYTRRRVPQSSFLFYLIITMAGWFRRESFSQEL